MAVPISCVLGHLPCEGLLCSPEGQIRADCGPGNGQNSGSAGDCGDHRGNAHEVDGASEVVGQGGEAKLSADVL